MQHIRIYIRWCKDRSSHSLSLFLLFSLFSVSLFNSPPNIFYLISFMVYLIYYTSIWYNTRCYGPHRCKNMCMIAMKVSVLFYLLCLYLAKSKSYRQKTHSKNSGYKHNHHCHRATIREAIPGTQQQTRTAFFSPLAFCSSMNIFCVMCVCVCAVCFVSLVCPSSFQCNMCVYMDQVCRNFSLCLYLCGSCNCFYFSHISTFFIHFNCLSTAKDLEILHIVFGAVVVRWHCAIVAPRSLINICHYDNQCIAHSGVAIFCPPEWNAWIAFVSTICFPIKARCKFENEINL